MVSIPRFQALSASRPRRHAIYWLLAAFLIPTAATAADPRPSPHRHVPAKNLVAYFEFDGLDAHATAWKGTSAHAALTKTKAGAMIREVVRQGADWLLKDLFLLTGDDLTGDDVTGLHEHVIRRGAAIAIHRFGRDAFSEMFVLNDFGSKDMLPIRKRLKALVKLVGLPTTTRIKGRDVYVFADSDEPAEWEMDDDPAPPPFRTRRPKDKLAKGAAPRMTAWIDGDDLIIVWLPSEDDGDVADPTAGKFLAEMNNDFIAAILDTTDGKRPNVQAHASYRAAFDDPIKGFDAAGLFFMTTTDDKGLLTARLGIGERRDALVDQSAPSDQGRKNASPAGSPLVDDDIRRASAETELLPPVFTDKDLEFLNADAASAKPAPDKKLPAKPNSDDEQDSDVTSAAIRALGLNGLKSIVGRFGFQGEAFLSDLRIEAPSPRKGLNKCFEQPTFRKNQLPPMPQGVATFAVASLDLDKTYRDFVDPCSSIDPSLSDNFHQFEKTLLLQTKVRFREDLLKYLGPAWCAYVAPPIPGDRMQTGKSDPSAYVLVAGVKDAAAFAKGLHTLFSHFNEDLGYLEPDQGVPGKEHSDMRSSSAFLEKLPAPALGYRLTARAAAILGLGNGVEPTIMIGKSFITLAATPDHAREALALENRTDSRWQPTGKLLNAFDGLSGDLTFLAVSDHRGSGVPDWIADLPLTAQLLINTSQEDNALARCLLDVIGDPRPERFRVMIDGSQIPREDELRPFLFPSVLAATVDERGYRFISREAFPLALLANETQVKSLFGVGWSSDEGFRVKAKINFTIFGLNPTDW